jgi:serine/threonine-protein kinase
MPGAASGAPLVTNSPTMTTPTMMTSAGVIFGTAPYMSPEQAKGRQADKRSDIWALGCVLYEMLTGRRAFEGDDVSDTLAAVLRGHPEWSALPVNLSAAVRLMLQRSLEKDRIKRIADVSTVRFVLTEPSLTEASVASASSSARRTPWWMRAAVIVMSALIGAAVFGFSVNQFGSTASQPIVTRFTYRLPDGQRFTNTGCRVVALSPDGTRMVYIANTRLYVKTMWDAQPTPLLASGMSGLTSAVFSPDGQWIAYWLAPRSLNKIAINTASARVSTHSGRLTAGPLFRGKPRRACVLNVTLTMSPSFAVGTPTAVARPVTVGGGPNMPRAYDIGPNNQFVMFLGSTDNVDPQINFVLNWFEELKRLVPAK